MYKCDNCKYIHWLDKPPKKCPKCNSKKEKFKKMSKEDQKKIEDSLYTNELLVELSDNLNKVLDIAADGIKENMDEKCHELFSKVYKSNIEMAQMIKAEIARHVREDKWG